MSPATLIAPPGPVVVRPVGTDEAELVHRLTQEAYGEYARTGTPSSVRTETAASVRELLRGGGAKAAVAEDEDGTPLGSVRYKREGDALYFFRLGVLPTARGRGVAKSLLAFLEAEARRRGAARLRCSVRAAVGRNVRLYEGAGFSRVGLERVYRGEKMIDLLVMEKDITSPPGPLSEAERGRAEAGRSPSTEPLPVAGTNDAPLFSPSPLRRGGRGVR